jgi:hypothetical protein
MFEIGEEFIIDKEQTRIARQQFHEDLYLSEHIYDKTVAVVDPKGNRTNIKVAQLLPLPQTISETWSDLLFLEFPHIIYEKESLNELIRPLVKKMQIDLIESAASNSAIGMLWWNIFMVNGELKYKFIQPQHTLWNKNELGELIDFKIFKLIKIDKGTKNATYKILEHHYAHDENGMMIQTEDEKKVHMISEYTITIDIKGIIVNKMEISEEPTGLNFIPVIEVLNMAMLGAETGRSDYQGKEELFKEIDNRYAQINYVINENSDPWILMPPGVLDSKGHFNRSNGKIIEKAGTGSADNDVSLVTWDGQLTSAFEAIKSMMKQLFFTSRLAAPIIGLDSDTGGNVESGRALKWRSVNTLTALGKRRIYWTNAITQFFDMIAEIDPTYNSLKDQDIKIEWQDGLPIDPQEKTDTLVKQVGAGIKSRETAIQQLDEVDKETAQNEIDRINTDQKEEAENMSLSQAPITV